ncbi:hypothetical protein QUF54_07675, partial [Candidatus Marithioploca araucensis]|nr:hypothetical protein [Candidatus Marithioploca araucensis]
ALFSEARDDLSQLAETIEKLVADQFEEMASAIQAFVRKYPPIRDIVVSASRRGAGGGSPTEITQVDERKLREELINAIRRNNPAPSQESKPKHDSKKPSH